MIAPALRPRRGDSAHWTPLIRIHKWNRKFLNGREKFWNGYTSRKRILLCVLFFCTWSTRWRQVTVHKACAYDIRKLPIHDLLISIHKTRGFEWQTAHTKRVSRESLWFDRINRLTDLWPQEMFTSFWKCFRWSSLKVVLVPTSVIRGLRGSTATSNLVRCMCGCHRGHHERLSRCRLVGSCLLPSEKFFTVR